MTAYPNYAEKIYNQAGDQFLRGVYLYADEDNKLFFDSAKTHAVTKDDVMDLYLTGIQVKTATAVYAGVACAVDTYGTVTVAVATAGDSGKFYTSEK